MLVWSRTVAHFSNEEIQMREWGRARRCARGVRRKKEWGAVVERAGDKIVGVVVKERGEYEGGWLDVKANDVLEEYKELRTTVFSQC